MGESTILRVLLRAIGPFLMGFGTIFQPKAHPDDHWSADPRVTIQVAVASEESGDPLERVRARGPRLAAPVA